MSSGETTVGVIDVGSNTIHLAVVGISAEGRLRYLADETELVRLGEDVSASGAISPTRMARAVNVISSQAQRARDCQARVVLGVATEGVRAAANGDELIERVERDCGLRLRLITGEQEAALTYWGATWRWAAPSVRQAVFDLGGGSLEIVVGERRRILWRISLPLGSGALYGRHVHSDPPTAAELDAVAAEASSALASVAPPRPVARVVACGGTATTLLRLASKWRTSATSPHDEQLAADDFDTALARLREQPADTLQTITEIDSARLRLLGPGAVTLQAAMARLAAPVIDVSLAGVREGAALAYVHAGERWLELAARGAGW